MSENFPQIYTTQFSTNLQMKLQQKGSKLRHLVKTGTHVGKLASPVQYMGTVSMQTPAGRFAPKTRSNADFIRRWVVPRDKDLDQLIDSFDEALTIIDPKSQYLTNAANAAGRVFDDEIVRAATAPAILGTDIDGLTNENFDTTAWRIAVNFKSSAASGLTMAKLIEAKRIFRKNHVDLDEEQPYLIIGSQQESDLLSMVEVVSKEFAEKPTLVDGKVTRILGFNIVHSERLSIYTTNTRGLLAFVPSGLYLGIWRDVYNNVSKRTELSGEPWGLYTMVQYGATRMEPGRLLQIGCADATGADITP